MGKIKLLYNKNAFPSLNPESPKIHLISQKIVPFPAASGNAVPKSVLNATRAIKVTLDLPEPKNEPMIHFLMCFNFQIFPLLGLVIFEKFRTWSLLL